MESENITDHFEDNRDIDQSRLSLQSTKRDSRESFLQRHKKNILDKTQDEDEKESSVESRSKTRTWHTDPDRDQISDGDGRRSSRSLYSDDYENESHSGGYVSPYSQSQSSSPTPPKGMQAKRILSRPLYETGVVGRRGVSRPQRPGGQTLTQQHRRGARSQSKESTPHKDLDLVAKRILSARLLKINELRNALAELQQHTDELQKENRILRKLQVRQEKVLQRYDNTESEISQLLSHHANETHMLRERLRRTQERERGAERRLKESEEQLHRARSTITQLRRLVDQRELGTRDELSRRLEEEKARAQEAERKIKELERGMELSNSSYRRQLATERKKTIRAQEEIRILQEELEQLTNKLKERKRELDAKNIYANRMMKPSVRQDIDIGTKQKVSSCSNAKALQTKDRRSSLDFPTPPPSVTAANEFSEQAPDGYLSLKELHRMDRPVEIQDRSQKCEQQKIGDKEGDKDKELIKESEQEKGDKQKHNQELNVLEEKAKRRRDSWEKEKEEDDRKRTSPILNQEEENNRKFGHVQEEVRKWNQDALANQQAAEEVRRKKDHLLAKMHEIDCQNQGAQDTLFSESNKGTSSLSSPRPPEQRNHTSLIFNLTEPEELANLHAGAGSREGGGRKSGIESGAVITGAGRRALQSQRSSDDLAFGSYAPSFGNPASQGSTGFPPPPPIEDRNSALEAIGVFSIRGVETEKEKETERKVGKGRKSSLMQQLFGAMASPAVDSVSTSSKMDVLNSPSPTNGIHSRRLSYNSGSSNPPASSMNTLHVADSRPSIRAMASFDDDIEELVL